VAGEGGAAGDPGAPGRLGDAGPAVAVDAAALTAEEWARARFNGKITGVSIAGKPVVTFKVTDAATGAPVVGLGFTRKSATDLVAVYPNLAFMIAKLIPGAGGAASRWVSYNVTTVPTTTATTVLPTRPTSDSAGTLVDHGDGSYDYTFYRDVTQVKAVVGGAEAAAKAADPNNAIADLDDLTYDATLTHRVVLQLSGAARGTGTSATATNNTPDGVSRGVPSVSMEHPINEVYDFIPATGKPVAAGDAQRGIVDKSSCLSCHSKFEVHGGGRQDPNLCATCHTDQRKYGRAEATTTAGGYSGTTYRIGGRAVGDLPNYIHKIHMGAELKKTGYNYGDVLFNEVTYPQPITNCAKCHDAAKAPQADSWKQVPTRAACGACHDGVNLATGHGVSVGPLLNDSSCKTCHTEADIATKHVTVDATGANGRGGYPFSLAYPVYPGYASGMGLPIPLASQLSMPAGVYKIGMDIKSVTVDGAPGAKKATVVYRITKNGAPVDFSAVATCSRISGYDLDVATGKVKLSQVTPATPVSCATNAQCSAVGNKCDTAVGSATLGTCIAPAFNFVGATTDVDYKLYTGLPASECLIDGVDGTPSIQISYARKQDGIAAPADWNASFTVSVLDVRNGAGAAGAQTYDATTGYYTAVLAPTVPDDALMVNGVLGVNYAGFVQLNLPAYPKGIRLREPTFAIVNATGYAPRRAITLASKCNDCHGQLGVAPSFHSGARNNGSGCAVCHTPNNSTSHTGASNSFGGGWNVSAKNLIHSIHASKKRAQAFTYEATLTNPNGFKEVTYPGVLNNCEQCHVPGSYDFSASGNASAVPNLLWQTEAKTNMTNPDPIANPSLGLSPWVGALGRGQVDYTADNLVSSPIAAACFGCHDNATSLAHILTNNGTLYGSVSEVSNGQPRAAVGASTTFAFAKAETCMLCHGPGRAVDIKAAHMK
jgi:OmcA/MtrC family decaheme c-type cytochrome